MANGLQHQNILSYLHLLTSKILTPSSFLPYIGRLKMGLIFDVTIIVREYLLVVRGQTMYIETSDTPTPN
jgi:hypothetical protein